MVKMSTNDGTIIGKKFLEHLTLWYQGGMVTYLFQSNSDGFKDINVSLVLWLHGQNPALYQC